MPADPHSRRRELVFWSLAAGYMLVYFHRLCPAAVAVDMMRDLGAGGTLTGVLGSAYFYPYAAMQLPAGLLADSWGPRRTVASFSLIAVVGSLALALAPGPGWAIAGRVLVGLGVSMLFVSTLKVLAEWFAPREFAWRTSVLMAMGGLGSLTATGPLALVSAAVGWRAAFAGVGLLTLGLAALVWFVVRDRPSDLGAPSAAPAAGAGAVPLGQRLRLVAGTAAFWPLAVWFFAEYGFFFGFGGLWAGPYLQHVHGLSRAGAGQVLSLLALGIIVGSPLHGVASRWVGGRRKPVIVASTLVGAALGALLALRTADLPVAGVGLVCLGLGATTGSVVTLAFTAAKELFPVRIAGTATGLVNLFPFAGGALSQPLVGHLLERHGRAGGAFLAEGYRAGFQLLFGFALVAVLASLAIRETGEAPAESRGGPRGR